MSVRLSSFMLFMKGIVLFILFTCIATLTKSVSSHVAHRPNGKTLWGKWATLAGSPSVLMAHRGEKVLMPEHTLASYEIAAIEGAEYVEPDLVLTKDLKFVCFHDLTLKSGTNVAELDQFRDKMVNFTGVIDEGGPIVDIIDDWFIKDFTLAELKELRIVQKNVGIRPQMFNDMFQIPTFEEYLNIIHHNTYALNRSIGVIPELKHPRFHSEQLEIPAHGMEDGFLKMMAFHGYPISDEDEENCTSPLDNYKSIPCGHVIVQSFEESALKYLSNKTNMEKMLLIDLQFHLLTFEGLKGVPEYADYYSVWKELLYTGILAQIEHEQLEYNETLIEELGGFIPPRLIVDEAHALGLKVGIYTIYDSREPSDRGCTIKCDPENKEMELYYYFDMGVDGIFVENVAEAREIRMKYEFGVADTPVSKATIKEFALIPILIMTNCIIALL